MERLGAALEQALADGKPGRPPRLLAPGLLVRNGLFFLVLGALTHLRPKSAHSWFASGCAIFTQEFRNCWSGVSLPRASRQR
jgi:hypothetical protein